MNPNQPDQAPLKQRLAAADPLTDQPSDDVRDQAWLHQTATTIRHRGDHVHDPVDRWRRRTWLLAGAAATVVAGVTAGVVATTGNGTSSSTGAESPPTVTELAMAPDTPSMSSCLPFSVDVLADMPVAFSGQVVERDQDHVLLEVDTWYAGGDTDQVNLLAPDMSQTSLGDTITFVEGRRYLIAAAEGTVNYCGFSGAWNQALSDAYTAAFPAS